MNAEKIVLVTGSNRGIGKEIARQLLAKNCKVLVCGRTNEKARSAADELGINAIPYLIDVTKPETIDDAFSKIKKEEGRLDVLINNAGILGTGSSPENTSPEDLHQIMDVNFYGPYRLIYTFLPLLNNAAEARVINISSGMGADDNLLSSYSAYRLSKNALNAQTKIWANTLSDEKIKVMAMCPGWVSTDMGGAEAPRSVEKGADTAIFLSLDPSVKSGHFYRDRAIISW